MTRVLAILFLVAAVSHSYTDQTFYVDNEPYGLDCECWWGLEGMLYPRYNVLYVGSRDHIYDDRVENYYVMEDVGLIVQNDSLFIDSVTFRTGWMMYSHNYFYEVGVPLSVYFPNARGKVFAEWFSDTIRVKNSSCKQTRNSWPTVSTNYIFVFSNGIVVKKGRKKCNCESLECDSDSTYKQLDGYDSPENLLARMDHCYMFYGDSLQYYNCVIKELDEAKEQRAADSLVREDRKKRLPKASVLLKPYYDSFFRPYKDTANGKW